MNLAKPYNLLSIMRFNGKQNVETLDQAFYNYFEEKNSPKDAAATLGRRSKDKVQQIELHDDKFKLNLYFIFYILEQEI